jgi:hypothetical protein
VKHLVAIAACLLVLGLSSNARAEFWFAPILGGADMIDGQGYDLVFGAYAGVRAPTGFVQVGTEALLLPALADDAATDPIGRFIDLRAARSFGPVSLGLHFDFIAMGNRDRRGEVGGELSFQYRLWGGEQDIGFAFGVGRGETFSETTQYVQLGYFGFWPVEDRRGIFLKVHASYHVWRWNTLGAPMLEPAVGLRF